MASSRRRNIFCLICMEQKAYPDNFRNNTCVCGELYCSECVSKHIVAKIDQNISRVNCPSTNCQGVLEPKECKNIIPKRVLDRWEYLLGEVSFSSAGSKYDDDLKTIELAKKEKWQRCPGCKFYVEKRSGCSHITCRCRVEFCYGCGAEWGSRCHEFC